MLVQEPFEINPDHSVCILLPVFPNVVYLLFGECKKKERGNISVQSGINLTRLKGVLDEEEQRQRGPSSYHSNASSRRCVPGSWQYPLRGAQLVVAPSPRLDRVTNKDPSKGWCEGSKEMESSRPTLHFFFSSFWDPNGELRTMKEVPRLAD